MAVTTSAIASELAIAPQQQLALVRAFRQLRRFGRQKPLGLISAILIVVLITLAIIGGLIAPYRYDDLHIVDRLHGPGHQYFFGTDEEGRDVFSRVLYGARTSVTIGFGSVALSTLLATIIGCASGYFGGKFDTVVQRFIDIWLAFPGLIFIIFVVSIVPASTTTLVVTLGLLFAAGSSRLIRSATLGVKVQPYIEAARATGSRDLRILLRYIGPNVFPIVIIAASIQIGAVIIIEASLSFLGFGTPPPFPSWGRMLQESQSQMSYHPYLSVFPGAAIAITVYAFNMFGDALRDVLDPRLRGTR